MSELTPEEVAKLEAEARETARAKKESVTVLADDPPPPPREPMSELKVRAIWVACIAALATPLWLMLAPIGYRMGWWGLGTSLGFMTREVAPIVVGVSILAIIIATIIQLVKSPKRGAIITVILLFIPIFMGTRLIGTKQLVANLPPIHDIQTDWDNPIIFPEALIAERAANNWNEVKDEPRVPEGAKGIWPDAVGKTNKQLQEEKYSKFNLRPQLFSMKPDIAFEAAAEIAEKQGWEIVTMDSEAGYIHATATTFWYGFVDDVIIRIEPQGTVGSKVNLRSVSRIGFSDMGANANRIKNYIDDLNLALNG